MFVMGKFLLLWQLRQKIPKLSPLVMRWDGGHIGNLSGGGHISYEGGHTANVGGSSIPPLQKPPVHVVWC